MKLALALLLTLVCTVAWGKRATFEWDEIPGAAQYQIVIQGGKSRAIVSVLLPGDQAMWSGELDPGSYRFRVRALDKKRRPGEWGEWNSFEVAADVKPTPAPVAAPVPPPAAPSRDRFLPNPTESRQPALSMEVSPEISYTRYSVTDKTTSSTATLLSDLNLGASFAGTYHFRGTGFDLLFRLDAGRVSMQESTSRPVTGDQARYRLSLGAGIAATPGLSFSLLGRFGSDLFATAASSTTIEMRKVSTNGVLLDATVTPWRDGSFLPFGRLATEVLFGGTSDGISVSQGFGFRAEIGTKVVAPKSVSVVASLGFAQTYWSASITSQTDSELAARLGAVWHFGD